MSLQNRNKYADDSFSSRNRHPRNEGDIDITDIPTRFKFEDFNKTNTTSNNGSVSGSSIISLSLKNNLKNASFLKKFRSSVQLSTKSNFSINTNKSINLDQTDSIDILQKLSEEKITKNYELTNIALGQGVGGKVIMVRRKTDSKYYAAKIFHKKQNAKKDMKYQLIKISKEILLGAKFEHENIIKTIDLTKLNSQYYSIMEYCPSNFFHLIKNNRLSDSEIKDFFSQLINGVHYLHNQCWVAHRDIKLENLCVSIDGILKIVDFGSAVSFYPKNSTINAGNTFNKSCDILPIFDLDTKKVDKNNTINNNSINKILYKKPKPAKVRGLCGSDPYIAPEIWTCVEKERNSRTLLNKISANCYYDARKVDIWSMAIVFVAMCSGKFIFSIARNSDKDYNYFQFNTIKVLEQFDIFESHFELIVKMLDLNPRFRPNVDELVNLV